MIELNLVLETSRYSNRFLLEVYVSLHGVNFWLDIGNKVEGIIYFDVRPNHLEPASHVPLDFVSQLVAIACGGRGYREYMGGLEEIFWFPSQHQKEHFLFLLGRLRKSEGQKIYTIEPDEITLDEIPF